MVQEQSRPDPAPGFPVRAAVADMGSNAIRLLAVEFIAPRTFVPLLEERTPVRLGHGVYRTGRLDADAMDGAVRTMRRFREVLDELGIDHHRAVATSAVRESRDGPRLVERVQQEASVRLEVVSGAEEIRLVYWAAREQLPIGDGMWALADLGGGSLEVALVDGEGLRSVESHAIGSVRLHEDLADASGDVAGFRVLLDEYMAGLRIPSLRASADVRGFAATGGNIEDLAVLAGAAKDENGVSEVLLSDLRACVSLLARLTVEERIERLGLREDRADVILPAAIVYTRLAELFDVDAIHVPHVGVKEGVVFDLIERETNRTGSASRHARDTRAGAVGLGRRFGFDEDHGLQVSLLGGVLFDRLAPVHGMDDRDREILVAAAILHDVGQQISYNRHHKHGYYLISNSEIPGFSPHEVELVALVARYHRKALPAIRHEPFAALEPADRARVTGLASILRLADALDREHRQRVSEVSVRIESGFVTLAPRGEGDLALEMWALEKKAELFRTTFDLDVVVEIPRA